MISPVVDDDEPLPVYVTDGPSSHTPQWLQINENESLAEFYDPIARATAEDGHGSMVIDKSGHTLLLRDDFTDSKCEITLHQTSRLPENGKTYMPPEPVNTFPLLNVDMFGDRLPEAIRQKAGLLVPIRQREALCLMFRSEHRRWSSEPAFAIKVLAGSVNAITGRVESNKTEGMADKSLSQQDYLIAPKQKRLDGFPDLTDSGHGTVQQFVAMPSGAGYTAEAQVAGQEVLNGLQLLVAPPFASTPYCKFFSKKPPRPHVLKDTTRTPRELDLRVGEKLWIDSHDLVSRVTTELDCSEKTPSCYFGDHQFVHCADPSTWTLYSSQLGQRFTRIHEGLATLLLKEQATLAGRPPVLQPVFSMTITIRKTEGRAAPGQGGAPALLTWRLSPFLTLRMLYRIARTELNRDLVSLFKGDWELVQFDSMLHTVVPDGVILTWVAASSCSRPRRCRHVRKGAQHREDSEHESAPRTKSVPSSSWELGIAAGGRAYQNLALDSDEAGWNWKNARLVNFQFLNSVAFEAFTGIKPPDFYPRTRVYREASFLYYHVLDDQQAVPVGDRMGALKTVSEMDAAKGAEPGTATLGLKPVVCAVCEADLADTV